MKVSLGMCGRVSAIVCLLFMTSGCATLNEPTVAYRDSNHPHSDTAVFAVQSVGKSASGKKNMGGSILEVDGRSMRTFSMTWDYPVWVRVLPGYHEFKIIYSKYPKFAIKTVAIPHMQPRHVYVEVIHDYGDTYRMELKDLGENGRFMEHLPWGTSTKSGDFKAMF